MVSSSYCGSDPNSEGNTGARQIVTFSPASDAGSLQRITELHPDMQRALLCSGAQAASSHLLSCRWKWELCVALIVYFSAGQFGKKAAALSSFSLLAHPFPTELCYHCVKCVRRDNSLSHPEAALSHFQNRLSQCKRNSTHI